MEYWNDKQKIEALKPIIPLFQYSVGFEIPLFHFSFF